MQALRRNRTTASQATSIEDDNKNPFKSGSRHSPRYWELLEQRRQLPVSAQRQEFLDVYHKSQVIILSGETGSGKTTQIPQFVYFDEFASGMTVACTQPRRLAATSTAIRVAQEMDAPLGKAVGYSVRFDKKMEDEYAGRPRLVFMTDGKLLRESMKENSFSGYSCVIVDEAHERSLHTEVLMALLKKVVARRRDLKVIIMSATLEGRAFQNYFPGASSFHIPGRIYPVQIQYLSEPTPHYISSALELVHHIHETMDDSDILLFLPTVETIEKTCDALRENTVDLVVLPLYASLSQAKQQLVFDKYGIRKCIVATNIAETSLTIDGVVYVIDPGLVNRSGYNPRAGLSTVIIGPISKAAAVQRVGRAGRTRPGVCFRLYTEDTFNQCFIPATPPGILEDELGSVILLLKSIGHHDVYNFDFLTPPHPEVFLRGMLDLQAMGHIDQNRNITGTGRLAAKLPIHPAWFNAIGEAHKLGCRNDMINIAALANVRQQAIFLRPYDQRFAADLAHQRFACPVSDHISQLHALNAYELEKEQKRIDMAQWCFDAFLNHHALDEAIKIRDQLESSVVRVIRQSYTKSGFDDENHDTNIRKALLKGFFYQAAHHSEEKHDSDIYSIFNWNDSAGIHHESSLVDINHEWVIYHQLVYVGKAYMKNVTAVEAEWLIDLPHFQNKNLALRGSGSKGFRQPNVKKSLDKARANQERMK